jgi:predicted branched-subunit amino acid permease
MSALPGALSARLDAVGLAVTTLPLSVAVAQAGVQNGMDPAVVLLSSCAIFSAALQLLAYEIASAGDAGVVLVLAAAMLPLRLLAYAAALSRHLADRPLRQRVTALFFLTDISFFEFQQSLVRGSVAAVARYRQVSLALWASWQVGTVLGLMVDPGWLALPKEGIGVLVFACLAVNQLGPRRQPASPRK